jgi:hypothetical protein
MRYDAEIDISPVPAEISDIKEESDNHSLFGQSSLPKNNFAIRKVKTRGNSRIIGDISKANILPDQSVINKRVIFYPLESDRSLADGSKQELGHKRRMTNQQYGYNKLKDSKNIGVRPMTAKSYYKVNLILSLEYDEEGFR